LAPNAGNWIAPIRKPRIMPADRVSKSVAAEGRTTLPKASPIFWTALFTPTTVTKSMS